MIEQVKSNLINFYKGFKNSPGIEYKDTGTLSYIQNKQGKWPNHVMDINWKKGEEKTMLNSLLQKMKDKQIPPVWITRDLQKHKTIANLLLKAGFRPVNRWNGMGMEIDQREALPLNPKLEIKPITREQELITWLNLLNNNLFGEEKIKPETLAPVLTNQNYRLSLAFFENKPVGTSLLFQENNIAGLYFLSVSRNARKKGIGSGLVAYEIQNMVDNKARTSVLHATKQAENIYKKAGYKSFCIFDILAHVPTISQ
jgi:ribosomal protein S18 acetylase RimI-like enzyme